MKTINSKLLAFQTKVNAIKKDGKNPDFKSSYATLNQILSDVKPLLSELGLVIIQPIDGLNVSTVITDSETGESVTSTLRIQDGLNAQQVGACITYYRRFTLSSLLSLEMEDDDANSVVSSKKIKLSDITMSKMLDAIEKGQKKQVEQALDKYELSDTQWKVIQTAFKNN